MRPAPLLALGATVAGALLLAACQAAAPAPTTAPKAATTATAAATAPAGAAATAAPKAAVVEPRGKVVFGVAGTGSAAFNPQEVISGVNAFWYWPGYDGLTWVDRTGKLQPGLAKEWSSPDGKTWTFKLRDDLKWHDGSAVEAADVAATMNYVRDAKNTQRAITSFADVANVTAPDRSTVVFELKGPVPSFAKAISLVFPVQGRKLEQQGNDFLKTAPGTGAYKMTNWAANQFIDYEAIGATWTTPRGVPPAKNLTLRFISEPATLIAALKTGEVDLATSIPADTVGDVKNSGFEIKPNDGTAEVHYDLNTFSGAMANVKVRQAVNHAVNKAPILQGLFGGYGELDAQMLGKAVLGYNPDVKGYAFDQARARQLLTEGGSPNGFRATMSVVGPSSGPGGANIASAIQSDLARVGIQVELETQDTAPWLAAFSGPPTLRKDISYATINWERNFEPDPVYKFWSSDRTVETGRRWSDDGFDKLYQGAKATLNEQQRGRAYQEAAKYINEGAPVLYLWTLSNAVAINTKKVDWQPGLFADAYFGKLTVK